MFRLATIFIFMAFCHTSVYSDCIIGKIYNRDFLSQLTEDCPPPLFPSKNFCCPNTDGSSYCCDSNEFVQKTVIGLLIPGIIIAVIIISFAICCISCFCCSFCPWYRRRHRGTVYGHVQSPPIVQTVQANSISAVYPTQQLQPESQTVYPPLYLAQPTVTSMPVYNAPAPPYTAEPYGVQPPFNPGYQ